MKISNIYRRVIKKIYKTINKTDIWVFGEWYGDRCCDNSLYLANYVVNNSNKKVYWVSNENADLLLLDKKIHRLIRDSIESKNIIDNAEVIIMNQSIYDVISDGFYVPKKSLLVNLWHGVPWKKILYDNVRNTTIKDKIIRKFNCLLFPYDMFLTPSISFEKIMQKQTNKDVVLIKSGNPRNSIFYNKEKIQEIKTKVKMLFNISNETKIVLYMPTFRDNNKNDFDFQSLISNKKFVDTMKSNNLVLIQKKHFVNIDNSYLDLNSKLVKNIINEIGSQELLAAADLLITDYSSCFFDYLVLDRPIIHFVYDYEYYKNKDRGLYYSIDKVCCGKCVYDVDGLINQINVSLMDNDNEKSLRKNRMKSFLTYENKNSCEETYKAIINMINKC